MAISEKDVAHIARLVSLICVGILVSATNFVAVAREDRGKAFCADLTKLPDCLSKVSRTASIIDLWPEPFPKIGREPVRTELTRRLRQRLHTLGLNNLEGLDGESISRASLLLPKERERAGVITFEIEGGADRGVHQCEALGRGDTSLVSKPGWKTGTVQEADGRETSIYYAPAEMENGATLPGVYELRNISPRDYKIGFLSHDLSGEEALVKRLASPDEDNKPYYSGVYKNWYPRNPQFSDVVPVDMIWSERYQPYSQGAEFPIYEKPGVKKDPEQTRHNPRYYFGPYGRYGTAIHTDRWGDPETALDPKRAGRNEFRSFLFRDTAGCVKVHPDCLKLINIFIAEQESKKRKIQLDVREIK